MAWVNGMIFAVGQKGELMSDLIDRQAAIDALDRMRIEYLQKGRDVLIMWECEDVLRQLPSAQPEIMPCDVCKYNPPSSADGKPCTMCPAERRTDEAD